eukprot:1650197-Pyramimonas_sp.AAC.1
MGGGSRESKAKAKGGKAKKRSAAQPARPVDNERGAKAGTDHALLNARARISAPRAARGPTATRK